MKATNWVGSVVGKVNLSCRTRRIVFPLSILGCPQVQAGGRLLHDGVASMQRFYRNTTAARRQDRRARRKTNKSARRPREQIPRETMFGARPLLRETVANAAAEA
jgi:hypothetical protein